jgi:hypothetical protein
MNRQICRTIAETNPQYICDHFEELKNYIPNNFLTDSRYKTYLNSLTPEEIAKIITITDIYETCLFHSYTNKKICIELVKIQPEYFSKNQNFKIFESYVSDSQTYSTLIAEIANIISQTNIYDTEQFDNSTNIKICDILTDLDIEFIYLNFNKLEQFLPYHFLSENTGGNINYNLKKMEFANDIINYKFSIRQFRDYKVFQEITDNIISINPQFIIDNSEDFYDTALPYHLFKQIIKDDELVKIIVRDQPIDDKTVYHFGYKYNIGYDKDGVNKIVDFDPKSCYSGGLHFTNQLFEDKFSYICKGSKSCGIYKVILMENEYYSYDNHGKFKGSGLMIERKLRDYFN